MRIVAIVVLFIAPYCKLFGDTTNIKRRYSIQLTTGNYFWSDKQRDEYIVSSFIPNGIEVSYHQDRLGVSAGFTRFYRFVPNDIGDLMYARNMKSIVDISVHRMLFRYEGFIIPILKVGATYRYGYFLMEAFPGSPNQLSSPFFYNISDLGISSGLLLRSPLGKGIVGSIGIDFAYFVFKGIGVDNSDSHQHGHKPNLNYSVRQFISIGYQW